MLNTGRVRQVTVPAVLKGVLITGDSIVELTYSTADDVGNVEVFTPMLYEPNLAYGRSSSERLDVLLGIGIAEDKDPADIVIAASKLGEIIPAHYTIKSMPRMLTDLRHRTKLLPIEDFIQGKRKTVEEAVAGVLK